MQRRMKHPDLTQLTEAELEHLLVERWLYRGLMLGIMLVIAILTTYIASRGLTALVDLVSVGVLVTLALVAAATAFLIRRQDLKIHQELRRRRATRGQE